MKLGIPLTILLMAATLFGCTSSSSHSLYVPLAATHKNPGHIGTTTLTGVGNQTDFDFYISGVPTSTTLPLRIYSFINKGSCQQPGPIAFAMNDKVNTQSVGGVNGFTFERSASIAMPELLSDHYSVVVRSAPEDGNVDLFCGDIAKATR
ncbi:hypothetical protein [Pseudomonas sp. NPDC086251]|uniref:hypothetical protein n=1 Tax=Pseudomonas sp. NPDC086251 TaxID=3364431 RepID=UPI003838FCAE